MLRKPRSNAKLLNLSEVQQAQLCDWLLNGLPYHQVAELVLKEFGFTISNRALSHFWEQVVAPALVQRRRRAAGIADTVAAEAAKSPAEFDAATLDQLRQKAFDVVIAPNADPREVMGLFSLLLKHRQQTLDEQLEPERLKLEQRRVELLEKRASQADQVESALKEPLTPEQQVERMRSIMGIV